VPAGIRDPYHFVFSIEETELILQGLGKLPAERSFNMLNKLGQEIAQENQRRQTPLSTAVPPPAEVQAVTPEGMPIASATPVQ
jgi:hypothetical protein